MVDRGWYHRKREARDGRIWSSGRFEWVRNWLYSQLYRSGVSSLGERRRPSGECMLMAGWPEGLMVEELGASMAVVIPVGGASLSGSNSSRMMRVL